MSSTPVIIDFIVKNIPEINRALKGVADSMAAAERAQSRSAQREAQARQKVLDQEAKAKVAGMRKADAEIKQIQDRAYRETQQKQAQRVRDAARNMQQEMRLVERNARDRVRIEAQAEREVEQIQNRARAKAQQNFRRQEQEQKQAASRAQSEQRRFATTVVGAGGRAVQQTGHMLMRGATGLAGMVGTLGGGFNITDVVQDRMKLERDAAILSNASNIPGKTERVATSRIMADAKAASIRTGTDASEIMKGLNQFTATTGDYAQGNKSIDFFAKVAKSTGSSIEDVAKTAGGMRIQNKKLGKDSLGEDALNNLILSTIVQARQGSVEFGDMAKAGTKITRSSAAYAGDQTDTQRRLLGLSQIGMRTSGNVEESATMLSNVSMDAGKHRKDVEKLLGGKFMDEKGRIAKGPDEFLADLLTASGGDLTKLQGAGFGARSMKMFQALAPVFNDAEAEAKKNGASPEAAKAAGRKALMADMTEMTASKYTTGDLEKDFAEVMKTSSEQFEGAMRELKTQLADQLMPEMAKLIPVLQGLVGPLGRTLDAFIRLANWAESNPFSTLGMTLVGIFAKEIIAAKIGETIKGLIAGGGAGGTPGLPGGAGAVPGAAGLGVGATMAVTAGMVAQAGYLGHQADLVTAGGSEEDRIVGLAKAGKIAEAKAAVEAAKKNRSGGSAATAYITSAGNFANYANPIAMASQYASNKATGGYQEKQISQYFEAGKIVDSEKIKKAIADAVAAGASSGGKGTPSPATRETSIATRKGGAGSN